MRLAVNRDHDAAARITSGEDGAAPGDSGDSGAAEARAFVPPEDPADGEGSPAEAGTDGRSARAQARREQRRNLILAAATRVFKEKGYHATSVGDIIDAAQIARGTFYLYFTSKREIFAALSAGFLDLIRGSVRKISLDPADGEPLAQMRANFRRVMHTVLEHEDLATIVLRDDALDAEARAQLDRFYDQIIALIGQAVRVGHRLGIARASDETIIAVSALGALKEILTRMLAARRLAESAPPGGDHPGGDLDASALTAPVLASKLPLDPGRLADELLSFFVRGVFTQDTR